MFLILLSLNLVLNIQSENRIHLNGDNDGKIVVKKENESPENHTKEKHHSALIKKGKQSSNDAKTDTHKVIKGVQRTEAESHSKIESQLNCKFLVGGKIIATGVFEYTTAEKPGTDYTRGIHLSSCKKETQHKETNEYLSDGVSGSCYIPYRLLDAKLQYYNPWLDNKYLYGKISRFGTPLEFKFIFPYKTIGWYINDQDAKKIGDWFDANTLSAQQRIKTIKSTVIDYATQYVKANKQLKSDETKKSSKDDQLKDLAAQRKVIEEKLGVLSDKLAAKQIEVDANAKVVSDYTTKLKQYQTIAEGLSSQNQSDKEALETAKTRKEEIKLAEYEKSTTNYKIKFDQAIDALKEAVPKALENVNKASTNAYSNSPDAIKLCNDELALIRH